VSDVRELTPEFFYLPEFLLNADNLELGERQSVRPSPSTHTHKRYARPCLHAAAPRFRRRASLWATSSCHRGHTATRTSLCANTGRLLSARACAIAPLVPQRLGCCAWGGDWARRGGWGGGESARSSERGRGRASKARRDESGGRASEFRNAPERSGGPCRYVSDHLHEWIDLVFGYAQRGTDANGTNARDTHERKRPPRTHTHADAHTDVQRRTHRYKQKGPEAIDALNVFYYLS